MPRAPYAHTLRTHLLNRAGGMSDRDDRLEALATIEAFFAAAAAIDAGDTEFAQLLSGMREALSTWWPKGEDMSAASCWPRTVR